MRSTTRAGYYPGAAPLTIKLVAEVRSGRLLGAQIVGEQGAGKRIDVLATALWNDLAVDDLLNVDLSYAPPLAPLWDPVLIAARKTWQTTTARSSRSRPASTLDTYGIPLVTSSVDFGGVIALIAAIAALGAILG